jgi:hypothetical protein
LSEINPQSILAGIGTFLDQAARAIDDGDQVAAANSLNDAKNAIMTLTGILELPPACNIRKELKK